MSGAPNISGDLHRRLVRHYLPLALSTAVALVLFMNLPLFDANRYSPPTEILSEGISGAIASDQAPQSPAMNHGGKPTGTPSTDPGLDQPASPGMNHGGNPTGTPSTGPGNDQPPKSAGTDMGPDSSSLLMRRYSTGTGYVALLLLGLTLLIGPANLVLRRHTPVSSYLRRDVGICAAIASVVHVVFGFLVKHVDGQILSYFFETDDRSRLLTSSFGLANWAGLAAVMIVASLAALSSNAALRRLKAKRWKRIQRLNYALFALVIVHSLLYGALWRLTSPYTVLLGVGVVAVVVGQAVGVRLWRRRAARTSGTAPA